jgi:hypothetical protein
MEVKELQDKHKDKLCFIYGAGPSLRYVDETKLKDYVNIAVNSGIVKHAHFDYFVSDDSSIEDWSYYDTVWRHSWTTKLLYRDKFEPSCSEKKNVIFYDHEWWFSPSDKKYNYEGLKLKKEEPIVGARTSVGSAIHLAYIMGCNPIVLLGNDCKIKDDKRYFWQYNKKSFQPFRISGYEFNSRNQNRGFSKDSLTKYWNKFAEVNRKIIGEQVEIIDCSDSDLRCFTRMHLQEIIDKYGDRK